MRTAPYRIETDRLVIRCPGPQDAPLLKESIDLSLPQLREWMPWALAEPTTLDDKVKLVRSMRAEFDTDADYVMGVFDPAEEKWLGGTGLHPRGEPGTLEIGYWIRSDESGRGVATEVAAVLTDVALTVCGAARLDVKVAPGNAASLRVVEKIGLTPRGLRPEACSAPDGSPLDGLLFSAWPDSWDRSRAPHYRAYDAMGAVVGGERP
jgi:RimJ/RimL family protein N-acetyltransferase